LSVSARFRKFLSNIALTDSQKTAGAQRREATVRALNQHYYGTSSGTANSMYVGSWGKFTRIRPPRDVDVLFFLPPQVYDRFRMRVGNIQSQLLQEVRAVLKNRFLQTQIKGDGPAVKVPFTAYDLELIPAFSTIGEQCLVCITEGGGYFKVADYVAESRSIQSSNDSSNGDTRNLIRMAKCWQGHCAVPIKSFWLEIIAVDFLATWPYKGKGEVFYDWMVRDFLNYMETKANSMIYAPGTYEPMYIGNSWISKARSAQQKAAAACNLESKDPIAAGDEWQKIFGSDIPRQP